MVWNHLLFEGSLFLSGYSGKYGFLKVKTPSDIARLLGQLRNYIYRNSVNLQIYLNG
jgi:hypothetical protein